MVRPFHPSHLFIFPLCAIDLSMPELIFLPEPCRALEVTAKLLPLDQPITDWPPYTASEPKPDESTPVLVAKTVTPLSKPTGVRVISDMDDTVKRTDLMHGLREVFRSAERLISNPDLGIG
jgi:hypothetical protein